MSALRTSANQQDSPSFWSLRPADDLSQPRASARPRRNRSGPTARILCGYYAERFRIFHIILFLLVFLFIAY